MLSLHAVLAPELNDVSRQKIWKTKRMGHSINPKLFSKSGETAKNKHFTRATCRHHSLNRYGRYLKPALNCVIATLNWVVCSCCILTLFLTFFLNCGNAVGQKPKTGQSCLCHRMAKWRQFIASVVRISRFLRGTAVSLQNRPPPQWFPVCNWSEIFETICHWKFKNGCNKKNAIKTELIVRFYISVMN